MAGHPVFVFIALAFGWSWSLELAARGLDGTAADSLHVAAKFGPSLAGLTATWLRGGHSDLRALVSQLLRWRVEAAWYALALLGPLALWLGAAGAFAVSSGRSLAFDAAGLALFVPLVAKHFAAGGGLGEELGWRGFLQPALERSRGFVGASLLVGLAWGLWHAPVFLLPTHGRSGGPASLALFTALCCAYSLIFARVLHGARDSLLVVALLHAATNAAENAVKSGFPDLRGVAPVTFVYGGLVLALAVACVWLRPAWGRRLPG
jgi:uncharacterized protein